MTAEGALWLPFTQMRGFDRTRRAFVRGEGVTLIDGCDRRLFDATSSIWTTIHGHGHPRIVEAIARQAARLDHATTLGATNPPAEELASRLCALTGMEYAFFASDGASAIEAAIKMALQFWRQVGEPRRTRFVRLVDAYHGDTTGAMSLSDIGTFKAHFGAVTFETLPFEDAQAFHDDVAAVIVEPLVQAAAGIRVVPRERYASLQNIAPLLIVDEIATGFGRTGTMFACEQLDLRPDLLCLGKGISGGTLALSATLVRRRVYDAFLGAPDERVQFFHGHSYAGNPIACAAALASLEVFEEETTLLNAASLGARTRARCETLRVHPFVRDARAVGTMAGIEIEASRVAQGDAATSAWRVADGLYERGHFTRPIGDVVQFVPPLASTTQHVDAFFDAFEAELGV